VYSIDDTGLSLLTLATVLLFFINIIPTAPEDNDKGEKK
jgi:hypothetical protein